MSFISMYHPLVKLVKKIDWKSFDDALAPISKIKRSAFFSFVFPFAVLAVYFTEGVSFEAKVPVESVRTVPMAKRMKEENLEILLQASIKAGPKTVFIRPQDFESVSSDTAVQPKNVAYPTDAVLIRTTIRMLVSKAKRAEVRLKRTFIRVSKKRQAVLRISSCKAV